MRPGGETVQPAGTAAEDWLLPTVRVRIQGCRLPSPQVSYGTSGNTCVCGPFFTLSSFSGLLEQRFPSRDLSKYIRYPVPEKWVRVLPAQTVLHLLFYVLWYRTDFFYAKYMVRRFTPGLRIFPAYVIITGTRSGGNYLDSDPPSE